MPFRRPVVLEVIWSSFEGLQPKKVKIGFENVSYEFCAILTKEIGWYLYDTLQWSLNMDAIYDALVI